MELDDQKKKSTGIDLEFAVEPRGARAVIVGGAPRRVVFPQRVAFLKSHRYPDNPGNPYSDGEPYLWSWVIDGATLAPDTPLLVSPFFNPEESMSHVYPNGAVCFGNNSLRRQRDLADSFWGSNMRVLPKWLGTPRTEENAWHAPVTRDRSILPSPSHAFPYHRPSGGHEATPRRAIKNVISYYFGAPSGQVPDSYVDAWKRQWIRVRAPWLREPVVGTIYDAHYEPEKFA